jgi:hypothetical protein
LASNLFHDFGFPLGTKAPHNSVDRGDKLLPGTALGLQELASGRREPVTAPTAFAVLLHPAASDQTAILQPEQDGVQRPDAEADLAVGTFFNQLADIVSVARPAFILTYSGLTYSGRFGSQPGCGRVPRGSRVSVRIDQQCEPIAHYSSCNARIGSSLAARRAGKYAAMAAHMANVSIAPANCAGSLGRNP